jgi:hypothetical protein
VNAPSGTAPPFAPDATGGVTEPLDELDPEPEIPAGADAPLVIKALDDVLEVEPDAFPDPLDELDDEDAPANVDDVDDDPEPLDDPAAAVALVRT